MQLLKEFEEQCPLTPELKILVQHFKANNSKELIRKFLQSIRDLLTFPQPLGMQQCIGGSQKT